MFYYIILFIFLLLSDRYESGSGLLLVSKYYAMYNLYDFVTIYLYSFFAKFFLIFLYFFRGIKYFILKIYTYRTSITFYFWSPTFKKTSYYSLFRSTRTKFL